MEPTKRRIDGRAVDQVRSVKTYYDLIGFADASILFELGKTKILVSVTLQDGVPRFLKGQKTGWLNAEYAMLPCSTQQRIQREIIAGKRNSRNVEISRLIGRCLRTVVDLDLIPDKTINIDCDVLQADGGTRVACITAASLALNVAANRWRERGVIRHNLIKESIAAISVGIVQKTPMIDLNYTEDSQAEADFNVVITQSGKLIELQGTAEKDPVDWSVFEQIKDIAIKGIKDLFITTATVVPVLTIQQEDFLPFIHQAALEQKSVTPQPTQTTRINPFSIAGRINALQQKS
ncbi:ribonuclease PH [bacterium]|nr:MAG: ribonuclease PH [bacterium]